MLRSIIENLTKRVETLEAERHVYLEWMHDVHLWKSSLLMDLDDLDNRVLLLTERLDQLHAVSDKPIVMTKPKVSHVIGKLRKSKA